MILYNVYIVFLKVVYFFLKIFPINSKKIFFLSRQSNNISLDYQLLIEELKTNYSDYKIVVLTKMISKGLIERINYTKFMIIQMYHLATSTTCIIDGYNVTVSILKHKKKLTIIQLWHAMGAIKKFGYQTLDKESGNNSKIAKVMKMHNNYDIIVSGSTAMIEYFSEAFNQPANKFITCGLPRMDYLIHESENNKKKIFKKYPYLKKKKNILYVPTFRKDKDYYVEKLKENINELKYNLIIKGHPIKSIKEESYVKEFTSFELLSIADYIITDYSAISIEASILNKPLYFYLYDLEEYEKTNGINVNLMNEMKNCSFKDSKKLVAAIESGKYDFHKLSRFKEKYIDNLNGDATQKIVKYIIGGKHEKNN